MRTKDRIIFALDVPKLDRQTHVLLSKLEGKIKTVKVGLELFCRQGVYILKEFSGFDVFLDLKLDDIPTTIERAVRNAIHPRVKFMTFQGDNLTIRAAVKAYENYNYSTWPEFMYVPMLSSRVFDFNPNFEQYYLKDMVEKVLREKTSHLVHIGFIASGERIQTIRGLDRECTIISPGVRLPGGDKAEHQKTATPYEAINMGADYIVVGRPIRDAKNPVAVIKQIKDNIDGKDEASQG